MDYSYGAITDRCIYMTYFTVYTSENLFKNLWINKVCLILCLIHSHFSFSLSVITTQKATTYSSVHNYLDTDRFCIFVYLVTETLSNCSHIMDIKCRLSAYIWEYLHQIERFESFSSLKCATFLKGTTVIGQLTQRLFYGQLWASPSLHHNQFSRKVGADLRCGAVFGRLCENNPTV